MARKCPPGVWCFTPTLGLFFILVLGIAIVFFTIHLKQQKLQEKIQTQVSPSLQVPPVINNINTDDRYTRPPEPLRWWQTGPDLRGAMIPPGAMPINVNTRGLPQAYQQMGIIKSGDQILPLYGRQTAYRSDRYNYYTRTDTYNPVQLPIRYERKDCMDTIGCNELMGGEQVKVKGIERDGHVEIYKFDGPTYIPGIV